MTRAHRITASSPHAGSTVSGRSLHHILNVKPSIRMNPTMSHTTRDCNSLSITAPTRTRRQPSWPRQALTASRSSKPGAVASSSALLRWRGFPLILVFCANQLRVGDAAPVWDDPTLPPHTDAIRVAEAEEQDKPNDASKSD